MTRGADVAIILWNRRFQPAALVLGFAALVIAVTWATDHRFDGFARWAAVVFAAAVGTVMVAGWIKNSQRVLGWGYLLSAGLWTFIAWAAVVSGLSPTSMLLSLLWAVLAGGSYLLEVRDGDGRWLP
jgi:hypothetical protein